MNAPTWVDLTGLNGGLFAAALVFIGGGLLWLICRVQDIRGNRQALRRRQITRQAPSQRERPRSWPAPTGVTLGPVRGGSLRAFHNVHDTAKEQQP